MDDAQSHEIVIIKRVVGGQEEGHHGGAWKIAFADFMTAMMALFLVMWLIAASDKTKSVIAKYFNPVQLVDSTAQPPGLSDPKAGAPSTLPVPKKVAAPGEQKPAPAAPPPDTPKPDASKPPEHSDTELFKDPYAVLAELAAKNSVQPVQQPNQAPSQGNQGGSGAVGVRSGEAYRDPFEPLGVTTDAPPDPMTPVTTPTEAASVHKSATAPAAEASQSDPQARAAALKTKIAAAMAQNAGPGQSAAEPALEVRHTDEGILIGLTDASNFTMFSSASAEPVPKLVTLMEKIGHLLKTEKGHIVVRGFTDNHPFRSDTYDNWRLSSARAHMAHYMLMRGGVEDARFERIEGFADRRPKNAKDPGGPENRRIEILLRDGTP